MATEILNNTPRNRQIEAVARGLVVQWPEPMNQKAEAVLISKGMKTEGYMTSKLTESDFMEGSIVIAMEQAQKERILSGYNGASEENTYVLNQLVGDELEVMNPYGQPIQTYGLCYEVLKASVEKLIKILEES